MFASKFAFKGVQVFSPALSKQIHASKTFFEKQLPSFEGYRPLAEKDISSDMKRFKGPIYCIGGFDGQNVVSVLSGIVNDEEQFKKNKTFYLLIQGKPNGELEELFRLKASPSTVQPGNGIVFLRPRGMKVFTQSAKNYDELNGALKAHYESDTKQFAADIKKLFKNSGQIEGLPQATIEAYMLLLFEIARRLVKSENPSEKKEPFDKIKKPSEKKEKYDILPIGSAIARSIQLLDEKTCTFEDVFLRGGKFHCFTGTPVQRERAIEKINAAIFGTTEQEAVTEDTTKQEAVTERTTKQEAVTEGTTKQEAVTEGTTKQEAVTEEDCLKALEQLFCSDERLEKKLSEERKKVEEKMKALMLAPEVLPPVIFQPSDTEGYTVFDYFEE